MVKRRGSGFLQADCCKIYKITDQTPGLAAKPGRKEKTMKPAKREWALMSEEAYNLYKDSDTVEIFEEDSKDGEEQLYAVIDCKVNPFEHMTEDDVKKWFDVWVANYKQEEAEDVAERIRNSDTWDMDDCKELCRLAGMEKMWDEADGESFEGVVFEAARKLRVDII